MADSTIAEIEIDSSFDGDQSEVDSPALRAEAEARAISQPSRLVTPLVMLIAPVAIMAMVVCPFLLVGAFVSPTHSRVRAGQVGREGREGSTRRAIRALG